MFHKRKALYTGVPHEKDMLCDFGACALKCSNVKKLKENIYETYPDADIHLSFKEEKIRLREGRKLYRKGLRLKNYTAFLAYVDKHKEESLPAEFLAGVADNENIGGKNLLVVYRNMNKNYRTKTYRMYNVLTMRLASHPKAGNILKTVLAEEGFTPVRKILAARADLPERVQKILAFDEDKHVKYVLRNNPEIMEEYRVIASL